MINDYKSILDVPTEYSQSVRDNMFFSDDYANLVDKEGRKLVILLSDEYIVPFVLTRKLCFIYGSFAYQPVPLTKQPKTSLKEFLDEVILYLTKKQKVQFLIPTPAYTNFLDYPTNSRRIPFGNYICDLTECEENLFMKMHGKHRNCVRKAQKDGVVVKNGCDDALLSDYMNMDVETWARSNKESSGKTFFVSKIEALPENLEVFVAYKDGEAQSGAIVYFDKICGYYMFGANKNSPYPGSGNLLQWEIMRWLKSNGVKEYSFVGCRIDEDEDSKYHHIQRFKQRFGGELRRGYMFKCVQKKHMYILFRFLIRLRGQKSKDVIEQEIHKWSSINC